MIRRLVAVEGKRVGLGRVWEWSLRWLGPGGRVGEWVNRLGGPSVGISGARGGDCGFL